MRMEVAEIVPSVALSDDPESHQKRSPEPNHEAFALFEALRAEVNQQRPRSPYSRSHNRSHSAVSALSAPPMARTRSLPLYETRQIAASPSHSPVRTASPSRPPPAARASPRRSLEEARPTLLTTSFMDIESIAEDSELDITPRKVQTLDPTMYTSFPQSAHNLSRSGSGRRRPTSPLQNTSTAYGPSPSPSTATATGLAPPPSPPVVRFNEGYPSSTPVLALSTSSSMPSTPTSFRSRSPSISSLETIPDTPDAEAEAIKAMEAYDILKLKAAADAEDADEERRIGRSSTRRLGVDASKRKRWSVCGAERRGDFEMETIWED